MNTDQNNKKFDVKEYAKKYYKADRLADPVRYKAYQKKYSQSEKGKKQSKKNVALYRERHYEKSLQVSRDYYKRNRLDILAKQAILRLEVLAYYSHGEMRCACCNESISQFLGLDHMNGGGSKHR